MIKKNFYLDTKYTVWERQHLVLEKETQEEIYNYIKDMDLFNINYHLAEEGHFDEINVETLYDTMECLPLAENGGQSVLELIDENYYTIKDNRNDIELEDVKMFSINDISKLWNACYDEDFIEQYKSFYETLLNEIK